MEPLEEWWRGVLQRRTAEPGAFDTGRVIDTPPGSAAPDAHHRWVNVFGSPELLPIAARAWSVTTGDTAVIVRDALFGGVIVDRMSSTGRQLPDLATVTAAPAGSETITVTGDGQSFTARFLASYVPQVGDTVLVDWRRSGAVVLGETGTVAVPPPPPPPPPPVASAPPPPPQAPPRASVSGASTFPAIDARSYRGGGWRTDSGVVAQHDWGGYGENTGAWFYGSGPSDALAGATVTRAQVWIRRRAGGNSAPDTAHLKVHASRTRPAGNVSLSGAADATIGIGESALVDVPVSWGQQIVNTGGGLGVSGSPYVVLAGLDEWAQSGALVLTWTRI